MAKCQGCSTGGCQCFLDEGTNVTITGSGTSGDPFVINAAGGGGSCAQKNVYTVATPSTPLLAGFGLDTPEPFFSCADFVGDGNDDGAAVQAAVDAASSVGAPGGVTAYPVVELLPGFFIFDGGTAVDPKGVRIKGAGRALTTIGTLFGAQRIFDVVGNQNNIFSDFTIISSGGAAINKPGIGRTDLYDVSITVSDTGADLSAIDQPIGNLYVHDCFISAASSTQAVDGIRTGSLSSIQNNLFDQAGIFLDSTAGAVSQVKIHGNTFEFIHLASAFPRDWAIGLVGNGSSNSILGNSINGALRNGIVVDGTGGGQFNNLIQSNHIRDYDNANSGTFDGIHLRDNTDESNVQLNEIVSAGIVGFAINIATADCNANWVTNNSFNGDGFQDLGTATVVVAGNRA